MSDCPGTGQMPDQQWKHVSTGVCESCGRRVPLRASGVTMKHDAAPSPSTKNQETL